MFIKTQAPLRGKDFAFFWRRRRKMHSPTATRTAPGTPSRRLNDVWFALPLLEEEVRTEQDDAPASEPVPAAQFTQDDVPELAWYVPTEQSAQADCPVLAWNVPGAQSEHIDAPVLAANVPEIQFSHDDWPVLAAYVPAEHKGHSS